MPNLFFLILSDERQRLDFHNNLIAHKKVWLIESDFFSIIKNIKTLLLFKSNSLFFEFQSQSVLINTLFVPRANLFSHFKYRPSYFIRQLFVKQCFVRCCLFLVSFSPCVKHSDGLEFYGNPPLSLEIHLIEELFFNLALFHSPGDLQKPIRERAFAVVNVRDYAEISNIFLIHRNII